MGDVMRSPRAGCFDAVAALVALSVLTWAGCQSGDIAPLPLDPGSSRDVPAADAASDAPDAIERPDAIPGDAPPTLDIGPDHPQVPDDAPTPADAFPGDAPPPDAATGPDDLGTPDASIDCGSGGEPFDYRCNVLDPSTCPGGVCALAWCLDPDLDPDRWKACGDGVCDPCEGICEVDCLRLPYRPTRPDPLNPDTLTLYVHGFEMYGAAELDTMVFGRDEGCGLLRHGRPYGLDRPCSGTPEGDAAPNQLTSVEYYGRIPADWMSQADIDDIEALPIAAETALARYALIVARFIRHKFAATGATQANIVCHSMGCLITRYIIEHDIERLASQSRIPRLITLAGALGGSRLAALYDNPDLISLVGRLGLDFADFVLLQPDLITDRWVTWDHRRFEGNHPYYGGIQIHHLGGTQPKLEEALNIAVLDVMNPEDLANDGVLYLDDTYFHAMAPQARYRAIDGTLLSSTRTLLHLEHNQIKRDGPPAMITAAALLGSRRVILTLAELELFRDRESGGLFDGENGQSPAEVAPEIEVRFDPFVSQDLGQPSTAHVDRVDHRGAPIVTLATGKTLKPGLVLFSGPVFDAMDRFHVAIDLIEVDWYPRRGIREWAVNANRPLVSDARAVALQDGTYSFQNEYARAVIRVDVVRMH